MLAKYYYRETVIQKVKLMRFLFMQSGLLNFRLKKDRDYFGTTFELFFVEENI